jgi:hypothetical protein
MLLMGPMVPVPVPAQLIDALQSVQVTTSVGGTSGFQLRFAVSQRSVITQALLPAGFFDPRNRVVLVAVVAGAALARRSRPAFWLFAGTGLGVLAGHAATSAVGPDILAARYLLSVTPVGVAVLAAGVVAIPWRSALPLAATLLVGVATFTFFHREGRELDPNYGRVAAVVENAHARVVLTNSAVVTYYLHHPRPRLDRPFGLGRGLAQACLARCRPFAIVDDARISAPRAGGEGVTHADDISTVIVPRDRK